METVLMAVAIILISGIGSLILNKYPAVATAVSVSGIVLGSVIALVPTAAILLNGGVDYITWPWNIPSGSF
jgi:hypothetical protein